MIRAFLDGRVTLHPGDCLAVLAEMEPESFDSCVTDPPYHLTNRVPDVAKCGDCGRTYGGSSDPWRGTCVRCGSSNRVSNRASRGFMGKQWDGGDVAFRPETWAAVLRVLKPGAHLVAFGGTRRFHRLVCAIEDAGFEVRDQLAWVYGSGFPKSHDVSKGIDKAAGAERTEVVGVKPGHEGFAGRSDHPLNGGWDRPWASDPEAVQRYHMQTAPATDAARQWKGWGTALKPSNEPIVWATKPFNLVPASIIIAAEELIGVAICLSLSPAKLADAISASNRNEYDGETCDSARLIAAVLHGKSSDGLFGRMDTFRSPEAARTIWNIVGLWSDIWGALCVPRSTFTTSTALSLTTGLRTFNSLMLASTQAAITQDATRELGSILSAPTAAEHSSGREANFNPETSARGLVSLLQGLALASGAAESFTAAAGVGSSVLRDAITNLGDEIRPSLQPICLARKPLIGTVAANVLAHGTGAINVDGCRVEAVGDKPRAAWGGTNSRADGWGMTGYDPAAKTTIARWPANLAHDGSEEVLAGFPETTSGGYPAEGGQRSRVSTYGKPNSRGEQHFMHSSGSAARFFYTAKADAHDRIGSKHPTVKPIDLMQWLVRLVTPKGGMVLDPFAGTGTTGEAAFREGMRAALIEREAEYQADIARRMELAGNPTKRAAAAKDGLQRAEGTPLFGSDQFDFGDANA